MGQSGYVAGKAASLSLVNAISMKRKGYSNTIAMRNGIVRQLFSETYVSEKAQRVTPFFLHERR